MLELTNYEEIVEKISRSKILKGNNVKCFLKCVTLFRSEVTLIAHMSGRFSLSVVASTSLLKNISSNNNYSLSKEIEQSAVSLIGSILHGFSGVSSNSMI